MLLKKSRYTDNESMTKTDIIFTNNTVTNFTGFNMQGEALQLHLLNNKVFVTIISVKLTNNTSNSNQTMKPLTSPEKLLNLLTCALSFPITYKTSFTGTCVRANGILTTGIRKTRCGTATFVII